MFVPFETLPKTSKVWIYPSLQALTPHQESIVMEQTHKFVDEWLSHGAPVTASFTVLEHRFLVIAADESTAGPSGCSIDSQVHFVQKLESAIHQTLTEKGQIPVISEEGTIEFWPLDPFRKHISEGLLPSNRFFYDISVQTVSDLREHFKLKIVEGWPKRFLTKNATV